MALEKDACAQQSIYEGEGVDCLLSDNGMRANRKGAQYPPSSQDPKTTCHISWSATMQDAR